MQHPSKYHRINNPIFFTQQTMNDWKSQLSLVYSTNPNTASQPNPEPEQALDPNKQNLVVGIERKGRGGKTVTWIRGYTGAGIDDLCKTLKNRCGAGGTAKDGEIIIQGDKKQTIAELLRQMGYKVKISG